MIISAVASAERIFEFLDAEEETKKTTNCPRSPGPWNLSMCASVTISTPR